MNRVKVAWQEGQEPVIVDEIKTLDLLLDRLDSEASHQVDRPFMVEIMGQDGSVLAMGLGRGMTVVSFISAVGNYGSVGDRGKAGTVSFFLYGHHSEFPMRSAVPSATARNAAREFFITGQRPGSVQWEEV
ncbi:MAG: Imm1 family immunity protein [Planctomycetota bacterium]|nr:Imm1 family immunity protein [Planctomycetota bacterium]